MFKKPNFFIAGAPKCGTTSMAKWLDEHNEIYMSDSKEPNFFNSDLNISNVNNREEYLSLFSEAKSRHKVVGEASVWYLYSREAVESILQFNKDAKFLIMLRNPIKMAVSLHSQEVYSGNENITDFREAWNMQFERKRDKSLAPLAEDYKQLLYGDVCSLGKQVDEFLGKVNRENVLFIFLEDLKNNSEREYEKVLNFLGVSGDVKIDFNVYNKRKERRNIYLGYLIKKMRKFKQKIPLNFRLGMLDVVNRYNTKEGASRNGVNKELKEELKEYFEKDIYKLSKILDKDLQHWLRV